MNYFVTIKSINLGFISSLVLFFSIGISAIDVGVDELDVNKLSTVLTAKYGSIHEAQQQLGAPEKIQETFTQNNQNNNNNNNTTVSSVGLGKPPKDKKKTKKTIKKKNRYGIFELPEDFNSIKTKIVGALDSSANFAMNSAAQRFGVNNYGRVNRNNLKNLVKHSKFSLSGDDNVLSLFNLDCIKYNVKVIYNRKLSFQIPNYLRKKFLSYNFDS